MKAIISLLFVIGVFMLIAVTCKKPESDSTGEITEFIDYLDYDPDAMLNVQDINGGIQRTESDGFDSSELDKNKTYTFCHMVDYSLKQNVEQVAIIRPTNGIIWPGALVKINAGLLNGLPEPVTLVPAPTTLHIDLPGMEDMGIIKVEIPSNSSTQAEINKALNWWNNNKYEEGYINASNSSYSSATSYSSEQLAMDLGLNVKWSSGEVSAHLNYKSSKTSKVSMMVFKQVFYTVTFDTPSEPGAVFHPSVSLDDIESKFDDQNLPGYVHSVSYGRIIMFRMTTDTTATSAEVEAALKYSTGTNTINADAEVKYKRILANSSIDVITIGGNADTASYAVTAKEYADLEPILTGGNAVYSKSNPGVPIAYTVKFLKDNKVAKMGYTTDYTASECEVSKKARIRITNKGGYIMKMGVRYTKWDGSRVNYQSDNFSVNQMKDYEIPGGSSNIEVWAQQVWGSTFLRAYFNVPETVCYKATGAAGSPKINVVDCPEDF